MFKKHFYALPNTVLIGTVFVLTLDRLFKNLSLHYWNDKPVFIFKYLALVFSKNYDISFSITTFLNPLYLILPIFILLIGFLFYSLQKKHFIEASMLFLIVAGASSNLFDRFVYGYVIDYISVPFFTVFNLADALICIGVILISWKTLNTKN